ncbi:hypothetical protein N836_35110 [Leptolyngbya sp. Heron Island J]|uniref:hypothetical protein n=1 Tax=Leptolyngbya sp. Heron Island J TaxID=1385935 RepID=UPI0003B9CCD2|nr:hypothetical protein [Leptolyngbya sp. Heron Island J]ESA37851.1 hypothetical protein N836_35110 [Leptolyngbya sp. Heron Island J]
MRITIEKGFQPLIRQVMEQIGVDDHRLALNHILGTYAASQNQHQPIVAIPSPPPAQTTDDDEYSQLADWS